MATSWRASPARAASLGGHLRLGKLKLIYDRNSITIDGRTDLSFSEDVGARFAAYGWHVLHVDDGNDLEAIDAALEAAAAETARPSIIVLRTVIADPAPTKRDTSAAHGAALGPDEIRKTKAILGWPEDQPFFVPDEAYADMRQAVPRGQALEAAWRLDFDAWAAGRPDAAAEYVRTMRGRAAGGMDEGAWA
jgi:transketolase